MTVSLFRTQILANRTLCLLSTQAAPIFASLCCMAINKGRLSELAIKLQKAEKVRILNHGSDKTKNFRYLTANKIWKM